MNKINSRLIDKRRETTTKRCGMSTKRGKTVQRDGKITTMRSKMTTSSGCLAPM